MTEKYVIEELRHAINDVEKKGSSIVTTNQLSVALEVLEHEISLAEPERNHSSIEFDQNLTIEKFKAENINALEAYKLINENGRLALRSLFLLNGGAAVAMAAFIGNASQNTVMNLFTLSAALLFFSVGVLIATIAHGTNFICSFLYGEYSNKKLVFAGHAVNLTTVGLVISGYVVFVFGLYRATQSFLI